MSSISMGELQDIGWYLKLEQMPDKKGDDRRVREKERVKQPLFQFRYDGINGKYIRELKESLSVDNAVKDPSFINGYFTTPGGEVETNYDATKISPVKGDDAQPTPEDGKGAANVAAEELNEKQATSVDVSRDNTMSYLNEDVFEKKRRWGKGIQIYRLVNGNF